MWYNLSHEKVVAFAGVCVSKVKIEDVKSETDEGDDADDGLTAHVVNTNNMNNVGYNSSDSDLESVSDED